MPLRYNHAMNDSSVQVFRTYGATTEERNVMGCPVFERTFGIFTVTGPNPVKSPVHDGGRFEPPLTDRLPYSGPHTVTAVSQLLRDPVSYQFRQRTVKYLDFRAKLHYPYT